MIRYLLGRLLELLRYLSRFISSFFRDTSDPVGDVERFITYFDRTYGRNHPEFLPRSYNQAVSDAKRQLKFLLIYLHSDRHPEAHEFCTDVLTHPQVISYISDRRILFWACSTDSSEGYKISQSLRENSYPLLALITLVDNQMTVVKKFAGSISLERFLSQLDATTRQTEASLIAARSERLERDMNRKLREEQDQAYMESLRADQEKERKKREERKKKEDEEKQRKEQEQNELKQREDLIKLKLDIASRLPAEPSVDSPDAINIMIKLPDGTRKERKFYKLDSVMNLYYWVFCLDESPLKFQLVSNFPKKDLPGPPPSLDDPLWNEKLPTKKDPQTLPTLAEVGLNGKAQALFVRDLEA